MASMTIGFHLCACSFCHCWLEEQVGVQPYTGLIYKVMLGARDRYVGFAMLTCKLESRWRPKKLDALPSDELKHWKWLSHIRDIKYIIYMFACPNPISYLKKETRHVHVHVSTYIDATKSYMQTGQPKNLPEHKLLKCHITCDFRSRYSNDMSTKCKSIK